MKHKKKCHLATKSPFAQIGCLEEAQKAHGFTSHRFSQDIGCSAEQTWTYRFSSPSWWLFESGWWFFATPLKNMRSSIGMMTFPIYGTIKLMFQTTNQVLKQSPDEGMKGENSLRQLWSRWAMDSTRWLWGNIADSTKNTFDDFWRFSMENHHFWQTIDLNTSNVPWENCSMTTG